MPGRARDHEFRAISGKGLIYGREHYREDASNDIARVLPGAPKSRVAHFFESPESAAARPTRLQAARALAVSAAAGVDSHERARELPGGGEGQQDSVVRRSAAALRRDAKPLRTKVSGLDRPGHGDGRIILERRRPVLLWWQGCVRAARWPIPVVHPFRRHSPSGTAVRVSAAHGRHGASHLWSLG